jgi:hypothetical protein
MKESSSLACLTVGIWKMRTVRSENGIGRCLLRGEKEKESHLLWKCTKTQRWREKFLKGKWPNTKEETAHGQVLADNNENVTGRKIRIVFCWISRTLKKEN